MEQGWRWVRREKKWRLGFFAREKEFGEEKKKARRETQILAFEKM